MRLFACFLALVLLSSCYRTVYRASDISMLTAMNAPSNETVVGHFSEEVWNHYFLFALVPTAEPDLSRIIARNIPSGHEVRNLKIRHEATVPNALVWLLVGGIYNPMTTTISGDIVKANKD